MKSWRIFDPAVERMPRVQILSLIVIGIPRSGAFIAPRTAVMEQFLFRAARGGERVVRR